MERNYIEEGADTADAAGGGRPGNGSESRQCKGFPCTVKERKMRKQIIKPVVLSVLFLVAVVFFSIITNKDNKDLTTTLSEASLPVVEFYQGDTPINELHGYVTKMDSTAMRDTITPVDDHRILPMSVDTYGYKIDGIRYEIRSMDGQRLVAKSDVTDYETKGNRITADLEIQNLLTVNDEYTLVITLTSDKSEIYYYTRLMQTTDYYTKECLDFALKFHDYTFRDDADKFIPKYMDATTGDNTTLNYVDLSCTLKQITWADLKPQVLGDVVASYKEINSSYNVITIQYVVTYVNDAGETEYYNVEEYYRLRMTSDRMYVLNFERTMEQIFRGENNFFNGDNAIQLGIRDADVDYEISKTGDIIAFVQRGELWCFDRVNNKIVQVFSFRKAEGMDVRDNWDQHDIKIARVDEAGSVDFVVYGYMNRGDHEGEVGTAVYHYDGLVQTIEEEVFIPSNTSYEILKAQMGQLMYVNEQGMLYLIMDEKLYQVNLDTLSTKIVVDGLKENCYKISQSNQYFAWVDADREYASASIQLMNLNDGSAYKISESGNVYLRPLGFIDNDFIYGVAKADEVSVGAAGNTQFPMMTLKIVDTSEDSHRIIKEYQPKKGRVDSISVEDYTITVQLMKKSGGQFLLSGTDTIMNREADTDTKIAVESTATDLKETQYQLTMKNGAEPKKVKMITSKMVLLEEPRTLTFEDNSKQERFYVYEKGDVVLATDHIADAILCANANLGVVVDNNQQYVWMRARKNAQSAFSNMKVNSADKNASSVVQAISAMLDYKGMGLSVKQLVDNGATPKNVLEDTLTDSVVLDVSGCTVNEILFYVSQGSPVFAMTGTKSAILVTGYSQTKIYYYDPASDSTKSMSMDAADKLFTNAGNLFFTYLNR